MAGEQLRPLTAKLMEHLPKFKITVSENFIAHYGQPTANLVIPAMEPTNI